jgi:hypothetical protein
MIKIPRRTSLVPYQVVLIYLYGSLVGAVGIVIPVSKGLYKALFPKLIIITSMLLQHALLDHNTITLEFSKKLLVVGRQGAWLVFCL